MLPDWVKGHIALYLKLVSTAFHHEMSEYGPEDPSTALSRFRCNRLCRCFRYIVLFVNCVVWSTLRVLLEARTA